MHRRSVLTLVAAIGASLVASCGGSSGAPGASTPPPVARHVVGGTIVGLDVAGLVLANGDDTLTVSAGATTFTLPTPVAEGAAFAVTVRTPPPAYGCAVTQGSGTMGASDVTSVSVTCARNAFTVGGTIAGLGSDGLSLANGTDLLSVAADATAFTMPVPVPIGAGYAVTVASQPAFAQCAVTQGGGTIATRAVTDVSVACAWGASVSTFAGQPTVSGLVDGAGSAARFNRPWGIARDSAGNFIVADHDGHAIRKVTPAGEVTTIAGTGAIGAADGPAASASFYRPAGVAVGPDDTIYVVDRLNYKVRTISPQGVVGTLAGSGALASIDGTGSGASFSLMYGIALDSQGNVFVGDKSTYRIRKITPAGVVTTFAGSGVSGAADGMGTAATFAGPGGLAIGPGDVLYVADSNNHMIRSVAPDGTVRTIAGDGTPGGNDGRGSAARFDGPYGLAVDAQGVIYVVEQFGNRIRRIGPGGDVTTIAGSGVAGMTDGSGGAATFAAPITLAIGRDGSLYVTDTGNHTIRRVAR